MADKVKQSWSARVLIYDGSNSIEEVMFDSFPADNDANARAFAIEFGYGYLKTLDIKSSESGVRVISVASDKDTSPNKHVDQYARGSRSNSSSGHRSHEPWRATFKCPIVKMCDVRFETFKVDNAFNVKRMADKAKEG